MVQWKGIRLVPKGLTQTHDFDYQETFALVAKMNTICVLLSLEANLSQPLQQLDMKNALLNVEYKSIWGYGSLQSQVDYTMFYKHSSDSMLTILVVYVDDIIFTSDKLSKLEKLIEILAQEFEIMDLVQLRYFLGMEITRSHSGIFVSQRKYTLELLKETGLLGCKPMDTSIDLNHKLGQGS